MEELSCSTCKISKHTLIGSSTQVANNAQVTSSVIGQRCTIGEGCIIRDSYIFNDAVIEAHCVIEKSIIGEGVRLKKGSTVKRGCLVGDGVILGPNALLNPFERVSKRRDDGDEPDGDGDGEDSELEEAETSAFMLDFSGSYYGGLTMACSYRPTFTRGSTWGRVKRHRLAQRITGTRRRSRVRGELQQSKAHAHRCGIHLQFCFTRRSRLDAPFFFS